MLAETAHNAGVITNEEFAIFQIESFRTSFHANMIIYISMKVNINNANEQIRF